MRDGTERTRTPETDEELLARAAHDPAALDLLILRYEGFVEFMCRDPLGRSGRDCSDRDVAQEVWLRFIARVREEKTTEIRTFRAWLMRVTTNLVTDQLRKRARENGARDDIDVEYAQGATDSPSAPLKTREEKGIWAKALSRLDSRAADVFLLQHFAGLKHPEIARIFGITPANARKIASRAKDGVNACFEECGYRMPFPPTVGEARHDADDD